MLLRFFGISLGLNQMSPRLIPPRSGATMCCQGSLVEKGNGQTARATDARSSRSYFRYHLHGSALYLDAFLEYGPVLSPEFPALRRFGIF